MKVFISQPMRGRSDEDIFKEREDITKALEIAWIGPISVIDSFIKDSKKPPVWLLGESIKLMGDSDAVVFAPKFEKYRVAERAVAQVYDLNKAYIVKDRYDNLNILSRDCLKFFKEKDYAN